MAKKKFTVNVDPESVVYSNISKSKDGYNSARMVIKAGEKDYMSISYEWEGDHVPDFAMNLMSFMQSNEIEMSAPEDYEAACKTCQEHNPEMYDKNGKKKKAKKSDDEDASEDE